MLTGMLLCMLRTMSLCLTKWKWSLNCLSFCFYIVLSFKLQHDGYWQFEILGVMVHLEVMIYVVIWSFPMLPSSIQRHRSLPGFKSDWARIISSFALWVRRVQCYLLSRIHSGGLSLSVWLRSNSQRGCLRDCIMEDIVIIQGCL